MSDFTRFTADPWADSIYGLNESDTGDFMLVSDHERILADQVVHLPPAPSALPCGDVLATERANAVHNTLREVKKALDAAGVKWVDGRKAPEMNPLFAAPYGKEDRHCCCPPDGFSGLWGAGPCPVHRGFPVPDGKG